MRATLPLVLVLASCAAEETPAPAPERDPAIEQALGDQIMIDPDLAGQNEGAAALTVPSDHSLPLPNATSEEIAAARAEAAILVGGFENLVPPPPPGALPRTARGELPDLATRVAKLPGAARCAPLSRSATWAARLPQRFPIYPRGATQLALGAENGGCSIRAVRFLTPVPTEDVLAFYVARARAARFSVEYAKGSREHRLSGGRGKAAFALDLREADGGLTEVDLMTGGL